MDWNNPDKDEIEYAEVHVAGPHHDFTCTREIHCDWEDERHATHYVIFEKVNSTRSEWQRRPFFYSCKECIPDEYWELNRTDLTKE